MRIIIAAMSLLILNCNIPKNKTEKNNIIESHFLSETNQGTIEEATYLVNNGDIKSGLKIINYLISKNHDSSNLFYLRGMCLYKLKSNNLALNDFNKSLSLDSANYRAMAAKGDVFQKQNKYSSAIKEYNSALVGLKGDFYLLNNMGTLYFQAKEYEKSMRIFKEISVGQPNNTTALYNLAKAKVEMQENTSAMENLKELLKIDKNDFEAYNLQGKVYAKLNNIEEAKKCWETSLRISPGNKVAIYNLDLLEKKTKQ